AMNIQPRGSKRLRYAGLFTARGREACLALCSKLIAQWQAEQPVATAAAKAAATSISEEQDPASDDFEEPEEHRTGCYCRVCQADLELVGRLKGTETHAMQSLAQNIVYRMLSMFAEVAPVGYDQLLFQLRIAWLTPKFLPRQISDLFVGRARLTSIECGVLEAFVLEELQKRKHTSGIPPPVAEQLATSELHCVA
ncbi:MAG: hypothetical protein SFV81_08680, partial [Pirellulaceae bacterium]|nr:hypothetical protein [Pirellulaceae bacterium]